MNPYLPPSAYRPVVLRGGTVRGAAAAIAFGLLLGLLAGLLGGCASTPERRLTQANDLAAAAYDTIANARDAGLVTQDEINPFLPYRDALNAALDQAGADLAAGDVPRAESARRQAMAAFAKLKPLLQLIRERETDRAR